MRFLAVLDATAAGVRAFKRTLETAPAGDLVAAPARTKAEDLVELYDRARQLQAKAASGTRGSVAARRELAEVRSAIMRRELAP